MLENIHVSCLLAVISDQIEKPTDNITIETNTILSPPVKKYMNGPFCAVEINEPVTKLLSAIGPRIKPKTNGAAEKPNLSRKYIMVPNTTIT